MTIAQKQFKKSSLIVSLLAGVLTAFIAFVGDIYRTVSTAELSNASITRALMTAIVIGIISFAVYYYSNIRRMKKDPSSIKE